jgi:hypothetical protein
VNTTYLIVDYLPEDKECYFSVANVENGVESLFSDEYTTLITGNHETLQRSGQLILYPNQPNPVSDITTFVVLSNEILNGQKAEIIINDFMGREIDHLEFILQDGKNKISYFNQLKLKGVYTYSLKLENQIIKTRKMVFL